MFPRTSSPGQSPYGLRAGGNVLCWHKCAGGNVRRGSCPGEHIGGEYVQGKCPTPVWINAVDKLRVTDSSRVYRLNSSQVHSQGSRGSNWSPNPNKINPAPHFSVTYS